MAGKYSNHFVASSIHEGRIARYNNRGVFIGNVNTTGLSVSPEGIVFGPDGNLYIVSFYAAYIDSLGNSVTDRDAILTFNKSGQKVGSPIHLSETNGTRVFARTMIIGWMWPDQPGPIRSARRRIRRIPALFSVSPRRKIAAQVALPPHMALEYAARISAGFPPTFANRVSAFGGFAVDQAAGDSARPLSSARVPEIRWGKWGVASPMMRAIKAAPGCPGGRLNGA